MKTGRYSRIIAMLLALVSVLALFAGCAAQQAPVQDDVQTETEAEIIIDTVNSSPTSVYTLDGTTYFYNTQSFSLCSIDEDGNIEEELAGCIDCLQMVGCSDVIYYTWHDDETTVISSYDTVTGESVVCVAEPAEPEDGVSCRFISLCADGENVYYLKRIKDTNGDRNISGEVGVLTDEGAQIIYETDSEQQLLSESRVSISGGKLYIGVKAHRKEAVLAIDVQTGEAEQIFTWVGDSDSTVYLYGSNFYFTGDAATFHKSINGGGSTRIEADGEIDSLFTLNNYVVFDLSKAVFVEDDWNYVSSYGIFVLDLETGETVQLSSSFADVIGVSGDWIYYYDESGLDTVDDSTSFFLHPYGSVLCRMKLDGSETQVLY